MTTLTNKPKRKKYSDEFKAYLVQEAESSGRSIASIARDNGINQNLLHNWKYQNKKAQIVTLPVPLTTEQTQPQFIPIILKQTEQLSPAPETSASLTIPATPEPNSIPDRGGHINDIQLQIPSRTAPIHLHIATINTHSLIELLRGLQ